MKVCRETGKYPIELAVVAKRFLTEIERPLPGRVIQFALIPEMSFTDEG
jgi:hypothetical protein